MKDENGWSNGCATCTRWEQAETMLKGQLSRLENYPELSGRIRLHIEETKEQAARLTSVLESLTTVPRR